MSSQSFALGKIIMEQKLNEAIDDITVLSITTPLTENINNDSTLESIPKQHSSYHYNNLQINIINITEFSFGVIFLSLGIYCCDLATPLYDPYVTQYKHNLILLYIFLYPAGLILFIDSIQKICIFSLRHLHLLRIIFLIILTFLCLFFGSIYLPANKWNGIAYFQLTSNNNNEKQQYSSFLSLSLFLTYIPISLALIYMIIRDIVIYFNFKLTIPKAFTQINSERLWILLFTLIILPFFWICTTLFGTSWEKMTPITYLIAFSKVKSPAQWTINIAIDNSKHYMHIYFDTLIFYLALIMTLLVSFIIRLKYTSVQCKLKNIIFYKKTKKGVVFISYGQFITLFIWFITIILIFIQFMWYHEYWEYLIGDNPMKLAPKTSNYFARSIGIISTILFGLAIIPVTRANPILKLCFGLSYENIIQYHRVLGLLCFFCMFLHVVIFVILLDHNNLLQHIYPFANDSPWLQYHPGNFTINIMYII
eukprot:163824_1